MTNVRGKLWGSPQTEQHGPGSILDELEMRMEWHSQSRLVPWEPVRSIGGYTHVLGAFRPESIERTFCKSSFNYFPSLHTLFQRSAFFLALCPAATPRTLASSSGLTFLTLRVLSPFSLVSSSFSSSTKLHRSALSRFSSSTCRRRSSTSV